MQRPLAAHERELLHFLLTVNESLYSAYVSQWRAQLETCTVREVNVPYCLAFNHSEERLPGGAFVLLARDLIGIDEGYLCVCRGDTYWAHTGYVLDTFDIDRLDGEPLVVYPQPSDGLMIMEAGKRIGGADLRHVFKESDLPPRRKLP